MRMTASPAIGNANSQNDIITSETDAATMPSHRPHALREKIAKLVTKATTPRVRTIHPQCSASSSSSGSTLEA